jgi:glycosyltransferase involved in cell wall biosynthesis
MQVSIIIPVFNEASLIQPFLVRLRETAPGAEIIVADGSSTDGTDRLAAGFCDQLVRSGERCRAIQMNAGARDSLAATRRLSINGQLRALRGHRAADAVWRSWNFLPANGVS